MIRLGKGILTWYKSERVSDRYGYVYLLNSGDSTRRDSHDPAKITIPEDLKPGMRVRLVVRIIDTRESTHIGDLFHGIFPSTPNVGDEIVLGEGAFSTEIQPRACKEGLVTTVGVIPDDKRETLWLDIRALYRCHEQTVELYAEPVVTQ